MPTPAGLRSVGGIGFVAAFVAGAIVYGSGAGSTDAEIAAYYASHGNRIHQIAGFALVVVAVVFFIVFVAGVGGALPSGRSVVAFVSGGCAAALLFAANALWASSALTVELESGYRIDPQTHLLIEDAGFALFVSAAAAAVPLVAAVSSSGSYVRWFALAGIVAAVALATSYWYFPFFVFLAWVASSRRCAAAAQTYTDRMNRRLVVLAALIAGSVVSIAMAMLRDAAAANVDFWFLVWNLGLAWIPFLLALGAYAHARRTSSMIALGVGWLLFFPNAPYIVTDFVHLQRGGPLPLWYDALTIAAFATVGLALGFASLYLMQCVVRGELGPVAGWSTVLAASVLGSIGIYLGRFVRANSWDVLTRPEWFARLAHARLIDPLGNPRLIAVTCAFSLLIALGYATLYRALAPHLDR